MKVRNSKNRMKHWTGLIFVLSALTYFSYAVFVKQPDNSSLIPEKASEIRIFSPGENPPYLTFPNASRADLAVQFFGVSTMSVCAPNSKRDIASCVLIDGFFSRPSLGKIATQKLTSDQERIAWALERAHFRRLDGIFVGHSHYDHLLDTAHIARRYSTTVYGTSSTAHVVRAQGLPESSIRVVQGGQIVEFDNLSVTILSSPHSPDGFFPGDISSDFSVPARVGAYREGGCFAFTFERGQTKILVVPSANVPISGFSGIKAQAVFLGVGALGTRDKSFIENYWQKAVTDVNAKEVVLIHWDDFTRPLSTPLQPLPKAFDDFEQTLQTLSQLATRDEIRLRLPVAFQSFYYSNGETE